MTGPAPTDLILHHFDASPFSEKVRVVLGMKGLAWGSVTIPSLMPKPDLVPLSGGYRRTPVMQVGADILCDTQVILAEIEARHPFQNPTAMQWAVNWWADRLFFQATVPIIFGEIGHLVPEAFIVDRTALSGRPFDVGAMKLAAGPLSAQWRNQAAWIEASLKEGQPWLAGASPGLTDAATWMNLWFLNHNLPHRLEALLSGMDRTKAWHERMGTIGHGQPNAVSSAEALALAKASTPAITVDHDPADTLGANPGDPVGVMADDYGKDVVKGTLVAANAGRIVIARDDPQAGRVHVHFPRAGYIAFKG